MSASERDRWKSGHAAQFFVAAEMTRRGYGVTPDRDRRSTRLSASSPKGTRFTVICRNMMEGALSWVVEPFEEDDSLYFALVVADLKPPYSAPQYWTLKSNEMKRIVDSYMARNPSAKSVNVRSDDVTQNGGWKRLPP